MGTSTGEGVTLWVPALARVWYSFPRKLVVCSKNEVQW